MNETIPEARPSSSGRERALCWTAMLAAGVVALAVASRSGQSASPAKSIGYALMAATGVSLLLGALGRRLVAVLTLALSVGLALLVALGEGHWGLWVAGSLGLVGSLGQLVLAPRWASNARRYHRGAQVQGPQNDLDAWKAFDAGMDPTSDEFGDNLDARETSPVATRKHGAADSGPDEEDQ